MSKEEEIAKGMVNEWQDNVHNDLEKVIDKITTLEQGQINLEHKIKFKNEELTSNVNKIMLSHKQLFSQNLKAMELLNERLEIQVKQFKLLGKHITIIRKKLNS